MGKPRGQRNAAREKHWPGHDAARVRQSKREFYKDNGSVDWRAVEEASNKLLPDMPTIEYGCKTIHDDVAVNTGARRKFARLNERQKIGHFSKRLDAVVRKDDKLQLKEATAKPKSEGPPLRETAIIYHVPKVSHASCDKCGKPRQGFKPLSSEELAKYGMTRPAYADEPRYCNACYRIVAREKREELRARIVVEAAEKKAKIAEKRAALLVAKEGIFSKHNEASKVYDKAREELGEAIDAYSFWVETFELSVPGMYSERTRESVGVRAPGAVDYLWAYRIAVTPDFTFKLFDAIEEAEIEVGVPYAQWRQAGIVVVSDGQPEIKRHSKVLIFRHDPIPRQNVKRMQQTAWRYSYR